MFKLVRAVVIPRSSGTLVTKYPSLLVRNPFCTTADKDANKPTPNTKDKIFLKLFQENFANAENKLNEAVAKGDIPSNFVYAKLFTELGERIRSKDEFGEKVKHYMKQMRQHNVLVDTRIYNNILNFYSRRNDIQAVFKLVQKMKQDRIPPDSSTFSELLKLLAKSGDMMGLINVLIEMKSMGIEPDDVNYVLIMESFASHGRYDLLDAIWKTVKRKAGLQNWSVMITSYGWRNMPKEIEESFEEAITQGWEQIGLYTAVISAAMRHHHCDMAEKFYKRMIDSGIEPNLAIISSMMNGYGGVAKFDEVDNLFAELDKYHLKADGKMLSTCVRHAGMLNRGDLVDKYWDYIVNKHGHQAEARDYLRIATAFVKTGDIEKSINLFRKSLELTSNPQYIEENFRIYLAALHSSSVNYPGKEKKESIITNKPKKILLFLDLVSSSLKNKT